MISLSGSLKKISFLTKFKGQITTLLFLPFFLSNNIYSQQTSTNIATESQIAYLVRQNGDLTASISLSLTNLNPTTTVVKYFTFNIGLSGLSSLEVKKDGVLYQASEFVRGNSTDIQIALNDLSLPSNSPARFDITFSITDFLSKFGADSFQLPIALNDVKTTSTSVSSELNNIESSSIKASTVSGGSYTFTNPPIQIATFITRQNYSYLFNINKTFSNNDDVPKDFTLSLPKSDTTQKILFNRIEPAPDFSTIDSNGNTFIGYTLDKDEQVFINVEGVIEMTQTLQKDSYLGDSTNYLVQTSHWTLNSKYKEDFQMLISAVEDLGDISNTQIADIANTYVKRILNSDNLNELGQRHGAGTLITDPDELISVEDYSDLTIALLREQKIPSRMCIGYLYNLFGIGSFHTWTEYLDDTSNWQILDPAYEDLSGNINSGKKTHISFVCRTSDSSLPKLTNYSQEEFSAEIGSFTQQMFSDIRVTTEYKKINEFDREATVLLTIENRGNTFIHSIDFKGENVFPVSPSTDLSIAPGEIIEIKVNIQKITDSNKVDSEIVLKSGQNESFTERISIQFDREKYWWTQLLINSIVIFIFSVILLIAYMVYKKKISTVFKIPKLSKNASNG